MFLNKRANPIDSCQLKVSAAEEGVFEGYASTFNQVDSYGDTILPGAYKETIKNRKRPIKMFLEHWRENVIGKWIEMKEDDVGLWVRGELTPGHSIASDVYASLKHESIDGLSIGYRVPVGGAEDNDHGGQNLAKIELHEISVVTMPADDTARIHAVKSVADEIKTIESLRDAELFLREAGNFPRSMAKALISQLRPLFQRDADGDQEQIKAMEASRNWLDNLVAENVKRIR